MSLYIGGHLRAFPRICSLYCKPRESSSSFVLKWRYRPTVTRLLKEAKISRETKIRCTSASVDLPRFSPSFTRTTSEPSKKIRLLNNTPKTSCTSKKVKLSHDVSLATKACPDFMFRHKFSILVDETSQSGNTFFLGQILTTGCIVYKTSNTTSVHFMVLQSVPR